MVGQKKEEPIREWYRRTTRRSRKAILYATILSIGVMAYSWMTMKLPTLQILQTFNGALSVPLLGGIWIMAFIVMFLAPSREVGFRSQETLEKTAKMLSDAMNDKVIPAMECWNRVGQSIEKIVAGGLFEDVKATIRQIQETALRLERQATEGNGEIKKFVSDTRPAIEALKQLQARINTEFGSEFAGDLKSAIQSVRELGGMPRRPSAPPAPPQAPKPALEQPVQIPKRPLPSPVAVEDAPAVIEKPKALFVSEPNIDVALELIRRKTSAGRNG